MMSQTRQRTQIESVPLLSGLCTLSGGDDTAQPQGGSVQRAGASRWGSLRASGGITAPQEPPQRGGELSKVSQRPRTPHHGALGAPRAPPRQQCPVGAERGAVSAGKVMGPRAEALEWLQAGAGQRPGGGPPALRLQAWQKSKPHSWALRSRPWPWLPSSLMQPSRSHSRLFRQRKDLCR